MAEEKALLGQVPTADEQRLIEAVHRFDERELTHILEDTNIHIGKDQLNNAFVLAVQTRFIHTTGRLIKHGADVNIRDNAGMTALFHAVGIGDKAMTEVLLEHGAQVNATLLGGATPLFVAAGNGTLEVMQLLLHHGADVNAVLNGQNMAPLDVFAWFNRFVATAVHGITPLAVAVVNHHPEAVKLLIKSGADLNRSKADGMTPLHHATRLANTVILNLLLESDAVVNTADINGNAPLHLAAETGNLDILASLISHKADINASNNLGHTPLHVASINGHLAVVSKLLKCRAEVNKVSGDGSTPLLYASQKPLLNIAVELIKAGADTNKTNNQDYSPLHVACGVGQADIVLLLLKNRCKVDPMSRGDVTPIYIAAQNNHADVVMELLKWGADFNAARDTGATPIYIAIENGHTRVVKILLEKGANQLVKDLTGMIPLSRAVKDRHKDMILTLLNLHQTFDVEGMDDFTPIQWACAANQPTIVEFLLHEVENINALDNNGRSLLHLAVCTRSIDTARLLLKRGADVDLKDGKSQTPLYSATHDNQTLLVKLLLKHNANINATSVNQETLLHELAKHDNVSMVKTLLDCGFDCTLTDKEKNTPLHVCARNGSVEVAEILMKHNAKPNVLNSSGNTPLHETILHGKVGVAETLLQLGADSLFPDSEGRSPLHVCALHDCVSVAGVLLKHNANAQSKDRNGDTVIHVCARTDSIGVAEILVQEESDLDRKNNEEETPLHICAFNDSVRVAGLLIKEGGDVGQGNKTKKTPLHVAVECGKLPVLRALVGLRPDWVMTGMEHFPVLHWVAAADNATLAKRLLDDPNTDVDQRDKEGNAALDIAVRCKNIAVSRVLVGLDPKCSIPSMSTFLPLHWSTAADNPTMTRYILQHSKKGVDEQDEMGRTALHIAGLMNSKEAAKILLEHNASCTKLNVNGEPPLYDAYWSESRDVFEQLLNQSCDVTDKHDNVILHLAARRDDTYVLRHVKTGALEHFHSLVHRKDAAGNTPLHIAVTEGNVDVAATLLEWGASVSAPNTDMKTPLDFAREKWKMFYLLQEADTEATDISALSGIHQRVSENDCDLSDSNLRENVHTTGSLGMTLLHVAVIQCRETIMAKLLELEADVNARDDQGRSPLHLATCLDRCEVLRTLLKAEAVNVDVKDKIGRTPLHWAAKRNKFEAIRCLLKAGANAAAMADDQKTPVHLALEAKIVSSQQKRDNEDAIDLLMDDIAKSKTPRETADISASAISNLIMSDSSFTANKLRRVIGKTQDRLTLFSSLCYLSNQSKGLLKSVSEKWSKHIVLSAMVEALNPDDLSTMLKFTDSDSINSANFLRQNALHHLAGKSETTLEECKTIVQKVAALKAKSIDFTKVDLNGRLALHLACLNQNKLLIAYLMAVLKEIGKIGQVINAQDVFGRTPLLYLVRSFSEPNISMSHLEDLIKEFKSNGAKLDIEDRYGESPLMAGCSRKVPSIIKTPLQQRQKVPQITVPGTVDSRSEERKGGMPQRVVHERNVELWIAELRSRHSSGSVVSQYLSGPSGPICGAYENRDNAERVIALVTAICMGVFTDMGLEGQENDIMLRGSSYEGTKTGAVDEMDFIMRLRSTESSTKVVQIHPTSGNVFAEIADSKGKIESNILAENVLMHFLESLKKCEELPRLGISVEDVKRNKLKVLTLVLRCSQRERPDLIVTADIVPSIVKDLAYNMDANPTVSLLSSASQRFVMGEELEITSAINAQSDLTQNEITEPPPGDEQRPAPSDGQSADEATTSQIQEKRGITFQCPLLMKKEGFEVSFSEMEHELILESNDTVKNAYMLLKILRSDEICPRLSSMSRDVTIEDIIPSYILKTGMMWVIDPEGKRLRQEEVRDVDVRLPGDRLGETERVRLYALAVLRLITAPNLEALPCYFSPSSKLRLTHNCRLLCQIMEGILKN